jgi:crotonobetaine/carnitine-CoA ligase
MTTSPDFPLFPPPSFRHLAYLLEARVRHAPNTVLIVDGTRRATAESLLAEGGKLAAAFAARGLKKGDSVAIQTGNRLEFVETLIACSMLGLLMVPINTASKGSQLAYYLRNSQTRLLITECAQLENLRSASLSDRQAVTGVEAIWLLDESADTASLDLPNLTACRKAAEPLQTPWASQGQDPAMVMYTSGTSGPSKGVICSHAQLFWWGHNSLLNIGIDRSDVLYTCLPLFHINALNTVYQALVSGGRVVLAPKFSVSRLYEDLAQAEATVTYLLGAMVPMLLSRAQDESEKRHRVRVALAPGVPEKYYEAFESRTGIRMLDGFGSTESNFVICTSMDDRKPGWMGKVAAGFEAKVVDGFDNEVAPGIAGELVLRNKEPFAFASGYYGMPEKSVEAWKNLWFHTGDRVIRDEAGYFQFIDRIKDSIRRRGENISSYEVEQVIGAMEEVESVAVYAVPSDLAEDEVMCSITLRPGQRLEPLDVIRWSEARTAHFSIPRYVRFTPDLPKTENGKIQKYKLRELGVTADTWDLIAAGYKVKR